MLHFKIISVRAGATISIPVTLHGLPQPTEQWTLIDGSVLELGERITLKREGCTSTLILKDVKRSDAQEYVITAKNKIGTKSASVYITVLGSSWFSCKFNVK